MSDRFQVQNYLEVEQAENPGNFIAMTCNAEYMEDKPYATDIQVKNYFGKQSLRVSDSGGNIRKDSIGTLALSDMQFFEQGL